jgi:mono/diheme cytochrome c family protein
MHQRFQARRFRGTVAAGVCASLIAAAAMAQDAAPASAPPASASQAPDAPAAPAPAAPAAGTPSAAAPSAAVVPQDPVVAKGLYLATLGDCVSCHTRPGGDPFAGGLPLKTPFGTVYTANITSDKETGIGGWTEEQFTRAMREGVADDGDHLYPAFPYTAYTKVTDEDIHAIYAYLKTLNPVSYTPPKNEMSFPFSMRGLLAIWDSMFLKKGPYQADASQSAEWSREGRSGTDRGHL